MPEKKSIGFKFALQGLKIAIREELNFQLHVAAALAAIVLGWFVQISTTEWLFVIGAIGLVMTAELLNTSLEELCDMLKTTHDPHVAKIKDLAAAGVFVASCTAFLIGVVIFLPKFF